MSLIQRIVVVPQVRREKPCVHGTRISVDDVLSYLVVGLTESEVLQDVSQLERDDVRACLAFAARRERITLSESRA